MCNRGGISMNFGEKKLPLIVLFIALLIFMLYFYTFLNPILKEIGLNKRESSSLQKTVESMNHKEQELEIISDDKDKIERAIQEKIESLPETLDSPDMIYLLSQANADHLHRHSLIFLEPVIHEDYQIYPVRFSFTADYKGLMDFLEDMDGLVIKPTISNIQIFSNISDINSSSTIEQPGEIRYSLDIEMTLNFYVRGHT